VIYDLITGKALQRLNGFVTPRNVVFAPDGKLFYVSDSGLGEVLVYDTVTLKVVDRFPAGPLPTPQVQVIAAWRKEPAPREIARQFIGAIPAQRRFSFTD
jgi:DNA-binding beta-propeller fold protein YncE